MLDSQTPSLNVLVKPTLALQTTRVIGGLREPIRPGEGREVWVLLLDGGRQGKAAARRGDRRAEGVALESCVEVVVLRGAAIDAKAGANDGFAVKR